MLHSILLAAQRFSPLDTTILPAHASETTHEVAVLIMRLAEWMLDLVGLGHNETAFIWVYATLIWLIASAVGFVVKWLTIAAVRETGKHLHSPMYESLKQNRFFLKVCRIIPPLVFLILIQFTLTMHAKLAMVLTRITWIYIVFVLAAAINTLVGVIWDTVNTTRNTRKLPLNGLVQLVRGIVWILAVIAMVSIIVDKSPGSLLAGLGAFAAVLMLVFKDSILGGVAGVQLSENDSLHVGDWITVDGTKANGTVVEVSLTTVKVQNWDKTVTHLPPYTLVSGSFTNYRNMQQSNTRRIQRSYLIDADSIAEATPELLAEVAKLPFMAEYIAKKQEQQRAGKVEDVNNSEGLVNGTITTNLGLFRAYMRMYLGANEHVDQNSDCFVSTLAPTPYGIPFQIYCFTNTSKWFPYEAIQDTIFEHVAVMLAKFGLCAYEQPSGRDTIAEGTVSAGHPAEALFGGPMPFIRQGFSDMPRNAAPAPAQAPASPA